MSSMSLLCSKSAVSTMVVMLSNLPVLVTRDKTTLVRTGLFGVLQFILTIHNHLLIRVAYSLALEA